MAAGIKNKFSNLDLFKNFLDKSFLFIDKKIFERIDNFDSIISVNDLNLN